MKQVQRELSPVERCKKNKWKKGTTLQCKELVREQPKQFLYDYWKITALGESEVLGIRVCLKPFETTGETIIPFNKCSCTWKKAKDFR
jgi:hypothetical protein